jgi:DNA-binding NarL/FixJ family response regulator
MKVLLADNHILFREGLSSLLSSQPDMHIVGTSQTALETVEKARQLEPDLILMNFNLSDASGLDVLQTILAEKPATYIVFLTLYDEDERLLEAMRFGAVGYLSKSIPLHTLLAYIRDIKNRTTAVMPVL